MRSSSFHLTFGLCYQTSVQVPSPAAGVIEELLVPDGGKVEGGTPLFKLRKGGLKDCVSAEKCSDSCPLNSAISCVITLLCASTFSWCSQRCRRTKSRGCCSPATTFCCSSTPLTSPCFSCGPHSHHHAPCATCASTCYGHQTRLVITRQTVSVM